VASPEFVGGKLLEFWDVADKKGKTTPDKLVAIILDMVDILVAV